MALLGLITAIIAWPRELRADDSARGNAASPALPVKRILIYEGSRNPSTPVLRWFLYDPLILSQTRIAVDSRLFTAAGGRPVVDLSAGAMEAYDLVIVAIPQRFSKPLCEALLHYLDHGGALLWVQPAIPDRDLAAAWQQRTGIGLQGYSKTTPAFSVTSGHPGARILGLPEGRSVLPHRRDAWYAKLAAGNAIVLTQCACGDPDLVLSSKTRCGMLATDLLADLTAYGRGDPASAEYQRHAGFLLVNAVRYLLGYPLLEQPVQTPQQQRSEQFQAYAAGREYVAAVQQCEPFRSRLSTHELTARLEQADITITRAAQALLGGRPDQCDALYRQAAATLAQSMQQMTRVNRFLIRGWHASIAFDDYYGGGVLGYAESEWSDHLVQWMRSELDMLQRCGGRRLLDVYANDWQILAKYYPRDVAIFREAVRQGYLEPIHGLYSAAFLPLLSEESNVRQLRYGTQIVREILGTTVTGFADPADHYDLHPQLPQLLASFGFRYAYLNGGCNLGSSAPMRADKIGWRGLDGTVLPAVPRYEGLDKLEEFARPDLLAQADKLGYRNVLLGWTVDATFKHADEQPHTLLDGAAPVSGKWVTLGEYFRQTPPPQATEFLGVDQLHADNLEKWSSWGCMNEAFAQNRDTENLLLAAERFHAVACARRLVPPETCAKSQIALADAWKSLLSTQDHMTFGTVDYSRQAPPEKVRPGEEHAASHAWGYRFAPLPRSVVNIGGMENYAEQGTANYGGPRIPTTRYEKVQQCYRFSQTQAQSVLDDAVARLVGSAGHAPDPQAQAVCIFNPLAAPRADLATIEASFPPHWGNSARLRDGTGPVEFQTLTRDAYADGSLKRLKLIVPVAVPSLGYKTYIFTPGVPTDQAPSTLAATTTKLESPFYLVELDGKHGGVRRIFDKQLHRELLAVGAVCGNELWSPEAPASSSTQSAAQMRVIEGGPLRATVVVRSTVGPLPYQCTISLYRDLKRIDFKLTVDYGSGFSFGQFAKSGTGLFVRFPVSLDGKMFINQPFGVYETLAAKQITHDFAAIERDGFGMAIVHGNTPCVFRDGRLLRLILSQGRPLVVGRQNYEYSIVSYARDAHQPGIYAFAQAINVPLQVYWPPAGMIPPSERSFSTIEPPNIALSALLVEGNTIQARLFETAGKASHTRLRLPWSPSKCIQVTLNGQQIRELALDGDFVELELRPWEIVTLSAAQP